jgi:NAD(P)-dependent dehydrogenase (short-subunit alcohol dehydrogenase family)
MRFTGKAVVITGGNSGIGLATAQLLRAEGARVAITGRNEDTLAEARRLLGSDTLSSRLDVTDEGATSKVFAELAHQLGALDGVFVNAGIAGATPIGRTSREAFDTIVRTNFDAAFFTAQAALPHLRDGASLVFNGSVHAVIGSPGFSAYAGSKAAVRAMVRNLASELAPRRIRVNQVTPGGTRTPIWSDLAPTPDAQNAIYARIASITPLGRMGEPDDIAKAVLFLLSDDSAHVTATELVVDGGAIHAPGGAPLFRASAS